MKRLFYLAAGVTKNDGFKTTNSFMAGFRVSKEESSAKGDFTDSVLKEKPGFALYDVVCAEIPYATIKDIVDTNEAK